MITGLVTSLHLWLTRPLLCGFGPLIIAAILTLGILFSFSRGAWAAAVVALGLYSYLYMLTARYDSERLKLAALVLIGAATAGLVLAAALQSDAVASLLQERAALTQAYDEGPDGRFGGQEKAFSMVLDNPFGIGAHQFSPFFHHEEPHNVYLSMLLNNGWGGGLVYILIAAATLALGFRHALRNTKTRGLFLIVYAVLAANIAEGVLIDSDHWRHFYLLMGVAWGLMAGDRREMRSARIVADRRPFLMQRRVIIPPVRRAARIAGRVPPSIAGGANLRLVSSRKSAPRPPRRRSPRILADMR